VCDRLSRRGNQLGVEGWAAVVETLDRVTPLESLNGCSEYGFYRAGGIPVMKLEKFKEWDLPIWVLLERSTSTLTELHLRQFCMNKIACVMQAEQHCMHDGLQ
jgi:hypothetical protein